MMYLINISTLLFNNTNMYNAIIIHIKGVGRFWFLRVKVILNAFIIGF